VFLRLARDHGLNEAFLVGAEGGWASPRCVAAGDLVEASYLIPPGGTDGHRVSSLAGQAAWLETAAQDWLGLRLDLAMLKRQSAVNLLLQGVGYSLALVGGCAVATM